MLFYIVVEYDIRQETGKKKKCYAEGAGALFHWILVLKICEVVVISFNL